MTQSIVDTQAKVWVAIDISKERHDVLLELPDGRRKGFRISNHKADFDRFAVYLSGLELPCHIAFEATGDYHRILANFLHTQGFKLHLVSSIATARTREALYNTWDKNDAKDAQVILHLLKTGATQIYHDPLIHNYNDLQEIANTYQQVSLRKTKLLHSILNHYLPLYFPEAQRYYHNSRAQWFGNLLLLAPCPAAILKYAKEDFIFRARETGGSKRDKTRWLSDYYETARNSVGLPVEEDTAAMAMFRLVLTEYLNCCKLRSQIEELASQRLADHPDSLHLQTIPGIGPILALLILAEGGDLRRFSHYRKFLKYCGLDLCTEQSGKFRGISRLSKRGNARLRYAFWLAATVAIRMRENSFRRKYDNYVKGNPNNPDIRRKAYTAVAAKVARVAYSLIKTGTDYCRFIEAMEPSGRIPSQQP